MDTKNNTDNAQKGKSKLNKCPLCRFDGPFSWNGTIEYPCLQCPNCKYTGQLGNNYQQAKEMWNEAPIPPRQPWDTKKTALYYQLLYGLQWPTWSIIRFQFLFDKPYNKEEYQALQKMVQFTFQNNIRMELLPDCDPFNNVDELEEYITQIDQYFTTNAQIIPPEIRIKRLNRLITELSIETTNLIKDGYDQIAESFLACNPLDIAILCNSTSPHITEESKKQYIENDLWGHQPPTIPSRVTTAAMLAANIRDQIMEV